MDIASRIKNLRIKKGITVNKLANLAGISQSYLRDIELGNKQPTVEYLSYICDALGISISTFFSNVEEDDSLMAQINNLTENQRTALLNFLMAIKEDKLY